MIAYAIIDNTCKVLHTIPLTSALDSLIKGIGKGETNNHEWNTPPHTTTREAVAFVY
jgi:hypothetical protein